MSRKKSVRKHREYSAELKEEAVQMLLDGHSAESVVSNLGLSGTSLVYRWKAKFLRPAAGGRQVGGSGLSTGRRAASGGAGA